MGVVSEVVQQLCLIDADGSNLLQWWMAVIASGVPSRSASENTAFPRHDQPFHGSPACLAFQSLPGLLARPLIGEASV